jgi:hypothetical protein
MYAQDKPAPQAPGMYRTVSILRRVCLLFMLGLSYGNTPETYILHGHCLSSTHRLPMVLAVRCGKGQKTPPLPTVQCALPQQSELAMNGPSPGILPQCGSRANRVRSESPATACAANITGACCYIVRKTGSCDHDCYSTRCEAGVAWMTCVEASSWNASEEGGRSHKFTAGAACDADTCPAW